MSTARLPEQRPIIFPLLGERVRASFFFNLEIFNLQSNQGQGEGLPSVALAKEGSIFNLQSSIFNLNRVQPVPLPKAASSRAADLDFPRSVESYPKQTGRTLFQVLADRLRAEPFNLAATIIFFLAIIHTFLAPLFMRWGHAAERQHCENLRQSGRTPPSISNGENEEVSFKAEMLHFLGEVEAIFGIWVIPLLIAVSWAKSWPAAKNYLSHQVNFTEPMFVVVVMTIAASRPLLKFAEQIMAGFAALGKSTPAAWWFSILTLGPLLGSFITEPAAMTISALLLARKFYDLKPSARFAYATLGLLFVNVSVGGTLTHFAAPPVLMVAGKWGWGMIDMLAQFGWKAMVGIVIANALYFGFFRREFQRLSSTTSADAENHEPVPVWITIAHLFFLAWVVLNNHYPALFIGGFLFYLAFTQATQHHQAQLNLRPALLVGFFLAGLVIHGGLQAWWIEPVLSRLGETPLFLSAIALTAFNDNAAITYLASLVPDFSASLKYAVVAGAVAGGGLTVIANAPNPAGQSILSKYFPGGVSPVGLFLGAAIPTAIVSLCFYLFR